MSPRRLTPGLSRTTRRALRVGLLAALVVTLLGPEAIARAQTAPFCAAGQAPQFQFGFAALKSALGDVVGDPTECEHPDADGNALQKTTTGQLFWKRSTNMPIFTAGNQHWAWTPNGLVQWTGPSMEPPIN